MHPGGGIFASSAPSVVDPLVSALCNGDVNTVFDDISTTCVTGVRFNTNGDEYETAYTGTFAVNVGTWLDAGTSDQVWVLFSRTAGLTNFDTLSSGARYQINTNRTYSLTQIGVGSKTITGTFLFYDAAIGGTLLDSTASATWTAQVANNPCPLCCFTPDTPITMASGIQMRIGDVREGDMILVKDPENGELRAEPVEEVIVRVNRPMYRITFADGRTIDASDDHPFSVEGKHIASINPTIEYKDLGIPNKIEVGDRVTDITGKYVGIARIEPLEFEDAVFTFSNSLFFANGLLVY